MEIVKTIFFAAAAFGFASWVNDLLHPERGLSRLSRYCLAAVCAVEAFRCIGDIIKIWS